MFLHLKAFFLNVHPLWKPFFIFFLSTDLLKGWAMWFLIFILSDVVSCTNKIPFSSWPPPSILPHPIDNSLSSCCLCLSVIWQWPSLHCWGISFLGSGTALSSGFALAELTATSQSFLLSPPLVDNLFNTAVSLGHFPLHISSRKYIHGFKLNRVDDTSLERTVPSSAGLCFQKLPLA